MVESQIFGQLLIAYLHHAQERAENGDDDVEKPNIISPLFTMLIQFTINGLIELEFVNFMLIEVE